MVRVPRWEKPTAAVKPIHRIIYIYIYIYVYIHIYIYIYRIMVYVMFCNRIYIYIYIYLSIGLYIYIPFHRIFLMSIGDYIYPAQLHSPFIYTFP